MAVYAYLRVSTSEQADSGLGLAAQRADCEQAAARLGEPLARVFTDAGISGGAPLDKRPALLDALSVIRRGDVLLVSRLDRLARDLMTALVVEQQLGKRKARVVSCKGEGTATDDPTNVLLRRLLSAFAEYEKALIAARTRAALRVKKARGERVGSVEYGFTLAADGRRLVPHAAEQRTLARALALRAEGLSVRAVGRQLTREGHRTRRGGAWSVSHLHGLLVRGALPVAA